MRESLEKCYYITKELFEKSKISVDYSDEQYNELVILLSEREELLSTLNPPFSESERLLGTEIIELNKKVEKQINGIKNQIAEKIKSLNKREKYIDNYTGYNGPSAYGYFYDKKK